jgi:hypothetical protein
MFQIFQKYFMVLGIAYLLLKNSLTEIENFRKFINVENFKYLNIFENMRIYVCFQKNERRNNRKAGVKQPGREAGDSAYLIPKVRIRGGVPPSHTRIHGVIIKGKENFTFTFFIYPSVSVSLRCDMASKSLLNASLSRLGPRGCTNKR